MRIAIVGGGVSGLVAAHLLHREHEIVVYEAGDYAGGHTNTIRVDTAYETHHVDTGFIVMNDRNYPNFTRLLDRLGVARQPTHMSFSVKGEEHDFEYSGTPRGLFCQPRQPRQPALPAHDPRPAALQPRAARLLEGDGEDPHSEESMQDFLSRHRFSRAFVERLILPQLSAVWSADPRAAGSLPGPLHRRVLRQPRHARLPRPAALVDGRRRLGALRRSADGAVPRPHPPERAGRLDRPRRDRRRRSPLAAARAHESFDHVVLATHSDQALRMLRDPSPARARAARRDPPTSQTRPCCTPTAGCCRAAARRARRGTSTCCASRSRSAPSPTT